jgi:hypothetical protein
MRTAIVVVAIAVALLGAYWLISDSERPAARVLNEKIPWESLASDENPARAFAQIVDDKLSPELARRLDIDLSDEAARTYMRKVAPEQFSAERTRKDQAMAARIADALELALVEGVAEDEVFESKNLAEVMTAARWEELLVNSTADHIPTLRTFAAAPAPMEETGFTEQVKALYLKRSFRDRICALPGPFNNIRERLLDKVGGDTSDPLLKNVSVFEAECEVERTAYINAYIEEAVIIYRDELNEYQDHLTVLH